MVGFGEVWAHGKAKALVCHLFGNRKISRFMPKVIENRLKMKRHSVVRDRRDTLKLQKVSCMVSRLSLRIVYCA